MTELMETLVRQIENQGVEHKMIPALIRDLALILRENRDLDLPQMRQRLHRLGWSCLALDHHMLQLASACFERNPSKESTRGLPPPDSHKGSPPEEQRDAPTARRTSPVDRRRGTDRRKAHDLDYFLKGGIERRKNEERRSSKERRAGWIRVDNWYSISLGAITRQSPQPKS